MLKKMLVVLFVLLLPVGSALAEEPSEILKALIDGAADSGLVTTSAGDNGFKSAYSFDVKRPFGDEAAFHADVRSFYAMVQSLGIMSASLRSQAENVTGGLLLENVQRIPDDLATVSKNVVGIFERHSPNSPAIKTLTATVARLKGLRDGPVRLDMIDLPLISAEAGYVEVDIDGKKKTLRYIVTRGLDSTSNHDALVFAVDPLSFPSVNRADAVKFLNGKKHDGKGYFLYKGEGNIGQNGTKLYREPGIFWQLDPFIRFYNASEKQIKFLKCGDEYCEKYVVTKKQ